MIECNRKIRQKLIAIARISALVLPILCALLLMSQVVLAKNTYVINDGERVLYHTTYATDPDEVLEEAGLKLDADDTYTTQESAGISEITIQRMKVVRVTYRGQTQTVSTYSQSVVGVLEELGIRPVENDLISVALEDALCDGMDIVIDRMHTVEETYTVTVPYEIQYVLDETLAADAQMILVAGVEGQVQNVDSVCYLNGQEISRENRNTTVVTEPVAQLVAVGSLAHVSPDDVVLPEVETGPEAITGNGQLYIGEGMIITPDGQILTYTDTLQVVATAYHNSDPGCTIWTAIGSLCRVGAIAVDPKVIPYGTRMYIVTNDGAYIYGIAVAEDCGGAIKGNRVDLYFDTTDECWEFGVRDATVYFLG